MNLEPRKIDLISWITNIHNDNIIKKLEHLRDQEDNWWSTLPNEIQKDILESESQADLNNLQPHEQVLKKYKKYLK